MRGSQTPARLFGLGEGECGIAVARNHVMAERYQY
jgi:hypothetical protein